MGLFSSNSPAATVIVIVFEIVVLLVVSLAIIVALYDPGAEVICPPKLPDVPPILKPPVIADPDAVYCILFVEGLAVAVKVTLLFSFWVKAWFEGAVLQVGLFSGTLGPGVPLAYPSTSKPSLLYPSLS